VQIEVRLYATLRQQAPSGAAAGVFFASVPQGSTVAELLNIIGVAPARVHMLMVNGAGVNLGHILGEGDRVGLFPPVGGG